MLTNLAVNDPRCPRLAGAYAGFARAVPRFVRRRTRPRSSSTCSVACCATTKDRPTPAARIRSRACACMRGLMERVLLPILLVDRNGAVRYFHADEAPCRAAFREIAFRERE